MCVSGEDSKGDIVAISVGLLLVAYFCGSFVRCQSLKGIAKQILFAIDVGSLSGEDWKADFVAISVGLLSVACLFMWVSHLLPVPGEDCEADSVAVLLVSDPI